MLEGSENPFGEIKVWKRLNIDRLFYFCMNGKYDRYGKLENIKSLYKHLKHIFRLVQSYAL